MNWFMYRQARRRGLVALPPARAAKSLWHYSRALRGMVAEFRSGSNDGFAFTATGASSFSLDVTPRRFLDACESENRRRMGLLDPRLLKPSLVPNLARTARAVLWLAPGRRASAPSAPAPVPAVPEAEATPHRQ
jgi:hypothetical protein